MHRILLLALSFVAAAAPAAAQAIVVTVRCQGECPAHAVPHGPLMLDSVGVWASLERGHARTSVSHVFRNETEGTVNGAFFFPLPADAAIHEVSVVDAAMQPQDGDSLLLFNRWSGPDESRWILEGILRGQPDSELRAYAGVPVVHVPVHSIPPHGVRRVQIIYTQPLRAEAGVVAYRYPLSVGAAVVPIGHLALGAQVTTEHGFRHLGSPSHAVDVRSGSEAGPCRPEAACGSTSVGSSRVRVVRLQDGAHVRTRDFELTYAPSDGAEPRSAASRPARP